MNPATSQELNIIVRAKDEASKVLDNVRGSAQKMGGGITNALDSARAGSFAVLGAVTAAGAGIGAFGVTSVKAYTESQNALAQLNAVLKSTHGAAGLSVQDLTDQATALQKVTKFSDEAVMATQAMILTFTNIHGPVVQQATQASLDLAQAMGMDGKDAALQLGKALNFPAQGLSRLQRIGVTFTDAQKKQVEAMVAAGDTAGAQAVILKELQTEFGGSAKAAGETFSGKLAILKNTFGDLQEAVGKTLVDALMPLADHFGKWIQKVQDAGGFIAYFSGLIKAHKDQLIILAGVIIGALVPAVFALAGGFIAMFAPLIPFIAIGGAIAFLLNILAERVGGWSNLLGILGGIVQQVVNIFMTMFWPSLQALWNTIAQNLLPALERLWNTLGPVLVPVLKFIAAVIGVIVVIAIWLFINALNVAIHVLSLVIGWISNVIGWFRQVPGIVGGVVGAIVGFFTGLPGRIGGAIVGLAGIITRPFSAAFDGIKSLWNNTVGRISFTVPSWVPGIGGKGWSFPKLAAGTDFFPGGLAMVGEHGPEMVALPRGAQVFSNQQTQALAGAGGPVINQTNNIFNQVDLDQVTRDLAWRLQRR